jgi:hypothetical protein
MRGVAPLNVARTAQRAIPAKDNAGYAGLIIFHYFKSGERGIRFCHGNLRPSDVSHGVPAV